MDLRSAILAGLLRKLPTKMGTIDGRSVRCHVWGDGSLTPVFSGGAGDDDDDSGGTGDDDDDDASGDDDEKGKGKGKPGDDDDDDDGDDDADIKNPKIKKLSDENAKIRVQRNKAREARDEALEKVSELETENADLKKQLKDGGSDDKLKEQLDTANEKIAELEAQLEEQGNVITMSTIEKQVDSVRADLKIKDSTEFVMFLLDKNDLLEVDEDGEIEDLEKHLKRFKKQGKLSVVSDDEDDEDDDDDKGGASGSSGRSFRRNGNKGKGGLDRAALEKKFPALRGR